ncbi:hypothetical protein BG015_003807 [Linnemannia schmuckeri]|uniref:Uncharacterized protein n=1 Tax=Linnemannia schmuckeri TaxID=64567 RepID=A0A9P5RIW2_9FUNG|nr:hypothetical protein BG015_003807 [Linnemannia schmuckeri]
MFDAWAELVSAPELRAKLLRRRQLWNQQVVSHTIQRQVHAKLTRLRDLEEINSGWSYTYDHIRSLDSAKWYHFPT